MWHRLDSVQSPAWAKPDYTGQYKTLIELARGHHAHDPLWSRYRSVVFKILGPAAERRF